MQKIMFNDKYRLTEAVLHSKKTMTRRIIKIPKEIRGIKVGGVNFGYKFEGVECIPLSSGPDFDCDRFFILFDENASQIKNSKTYSKYRIGETVAVSESYTNIHSEFAADGCINCPILYDKLSDYGCKNSKGWSNKMFVKAELMPHNIQISNIQIQRLQDISEEDCLREGIMNGEFINTRDEYYYDIVGDAILHKTFSSPRKAYASLINKIGGGGTWESNPYVFVYEFKILK